MQQAQRKEKNPNIKPMRVAFLKISPLEVGTPCCIRRRCARGFVIIFDYGVPADEVQPEVRAYCIKVNGSTLIVKAGDIGKD